MNKVIYTARVSFHFYLFTVHDVMHPTLLFKVSNQCNEILWSAWARSGLLLDYLQSHVLIASSWFWSGTSIVWMLLQWNAHQPKNTRKVDWRHTRLLNFLPMLGGKNVVYMVQSLNSCTVSALLLLGIYPESWLTTDIQQFSQLWTILDVVSIKQISSLCLTLFIKSCFWVAW